MPFSAVTIALTDRSSASAGLGALFRVGFTYAWRHGRLPALANPARFTEFVQQRKLVDRDPRLSALADKVAVKPLVAAQLGDAWVTPTLWHGDRLPDRPRWPTPFVVKARHGCRQTVFVRDSGQDWQAAMRASRRWMQHDYGGWLDEWLYAHIPRGILVEPHVGDSDRLPVDYKFYVFGGRVAIVQIHLDRNGRHRWVVVDRNWRRRSRDDDAPLPPRPAPLQAMIEAAETLGRGFDFVRVDLYDVGGQPRFGEMTFYPGSGLDRFDPVALDLELGALWAAQTSPRPTQSYASPAASTLARS